MFKKILEQMRALAYSLLAKKMGIKTVAVYSTADAESFMLNLLTSCFV
jgi:acetyl/propionyl-CoA carboxylase alpha subunit